MDIRASEIWLTVVGLLLAALGVFMAVANESHLFHTVFDPLVDRTFWTDGIPAEVQEFRSWVYGVWGATVAGFGLLIAHVARQSTTLGNTRMRWGVLAAILLWFVIDTTISISHGVWGNVFMVNVPILLAVGIPLALTRAVPTHTHQGSNTHEAKP